MKIIIVDVETLFSVDSATAAKGCMKDFSILGRFLGLGDNNDCFGIRFTSLKEAPYRNKNQVFLLHPSYQ